MITHYKENSVLTDENTLARGIGFNEGKYPTSVDSKRVKEYTTWNDMLSRCTAKFWGRRPTYAGTTCSDNFKSYTYFYEWCQTQVGFSNKDENGKSWHLDKDLLVKGNKVYSEDTCVFLPSRINCLLIKCDSARGEYPVGVSWDKREKYFATSCADFESVRRHLGYFKTAAEAFIAYKTYKEGIIKQVATHYEHSIDNRAYNALMKYKVTEKD